MCTTFLQMQFIAVCYAYEMEYHYKLFIFAFLDNSDGLWLNDHFL